QFGLLEMSRQRIRHSITFGSYESCKHCNGRGQTPSVETQGLAFLRQLNLKALKAEVHSVTGIIPKEVAGYILNKKREELIDIELQLKVSITIESDADMVAGQNKIICNK
ncbi:MAG: ribonuclease, partial [Desulfobacteraceae bacterium]|nr:ribonuclease [Desulfobacteraceae bacterium]